MTIDVNQVKQVEATYVLQVYRRIPVVLVRGEGSRVYDADGKEYIDLLSGIGVASLGHAHPVLADAIAAQAHELLHTSNLFFHPLQGQVASALASLSGLTRTFFTNSGTEAVEACLKFARRYWFKNGSPSRTELIALDRSFHGRTFGSLSVTSEASYRKPFEPLVPGVTFVSPDDPESLHRAVSGRTAAIIVEPIQGEGGIWPLSPAMADVIRTVCADTGRPFHSATLDLRPDLMPLGKSLGGGVPVGAALMTERVAEAIAFGDHGSTYGGNLLACRAALVFLDALQAGLIDRVNTAGARLEAGLRTLAERYTAIREIRGAGLMWGLDVDKTVAEVIVGAALDQGLIINRTADTVIRLLPPLTISNDDIDAGLTRLDRAIETVTAGTT